MGRGIRRIVDQLPLPQILLVAKATLLSIEAFRTIRQGDIDLLPLNAAGEVPLVNEMFGLAA